MTPSHARVDRKASAKRWQGKTKARLLSSEISSSGTPTLFTSGEGHTVRGDSASRTLVPRSRRPCACVDTLCTRTGRSQQRPMVGPVREGLLALDLPSLEAWEDEFKDLAPAQVERISSPEFYDFLRVHVTRKYLAPV